jgi:hypothetical protein
MVVLWSLTAWATECAQPLVRTEIEAIADAAAAAVEADDAGRFRERMRQFTRMVPCLREPLPAAPWARLLVLDAVVVFAEGRDPTSQLGTALRIDPDVPIPDFLRERARAETLGEEGALPAGSKAWVDGQRVNGFPVLTGDHVLQLERDGSWEAVFGNTPPRAWIDRTAVVPRPTPDQPPARELVTRIALGTASLGVERIAQRPDVPGDFVPEAEVTSPSLVIGGELGLDVATAVGGWARGGVPLRLGRLSGGGVRFAPRAELGVDGPLGPLRVEVGLSAAFTPTLQGGRNLPRPDLLPLLGARWWGDQGDAGLSVAGWLDSARIQGRFGWTLDVEALGQGKVRLGAEAAWHGRGFRQQVPGGPRGVRAAGLEVLACAGLIWR